MTFVDAMMLLAVLVIVPAAIPLHPAGSARVATVAAVAGLPAVPAHIIDQGPAAAALVAPWLIAALVGAFIAIRWWRLTGFGFRDVAWAAAALYRSSRPSGSSPTGSTCHWPASPPRSSS